MICSRSVSYPGSKPWHATGGLLQHLPRGRGREGPVANAAGRQHPLYGDRRKSTDPGREHSQLGPRACIDSPAGVCHRKNQRYRVGHHLAPRDATRAVLDVERPSVGKPRAAARPRLSSGGMAPPRQVSIVAPKECGIIVSCCHTVTEQSWQRFGERIKRNEPG